MRDWKETLELALFLTLISILGNYIAHCLEEIVKGIFL